MKGKFKKTMAFFLAALIAVSAINTGYVFADEENNASEEVMEVSESVETEDLGIGGEESIIIPIIARGRSGNGSAYISTGSSISFSSVGFDDGTGWGSRYFNLVSDGVTYIAYCLEPSVTYPLSNDYAYQEVNNNEGLAKALYYAHGGPGQDEYITTIGLSGEAQYILSHVVCAYFYGSTDWSYGLNSTGVAYANHFIDWINNAPSIPESKISLSSSTLTANVEGTIQKTNSITFNGDTRNVLTISLQTGVSLHNVTKGTTSDGTVTISGGDSFYLTAPLDLTSIQDSSWSTGNLLGSITYRYSPLIFNTSNTTQHIGSYNYTYDSSNTVNFTVDWVNVGNIKIKKVSEDGVVSGLKFKIEGNGISETVITGSDGTVILENLVSGTYTVTEISTPDRYVTPSSQKITVTAGETKEVDFSNVLKKWKMTVTKTDSDTGTAQGAATLSGAVYGIYKDGKLVDIYTTNENGQFTTDYYICGDDYTIKEISQSKGYLLDDTEYDINGAEAGNFTVELNTLTSGVTEDVIRGDLKGIKVSDGDMKRMAGVLFQITSVTTGESHIIVTDENGQFDTSSDWNPHSQNTNRGETAYDGVWFGEGEANDDLGALLYDTYLIEELPCEANEGMITFEPFQIMISRDSVTIDLGTITNDYEAQPEIGTTAIDREAGGHIGYVGEMTTIIDAVDYINLTVGLEYTVKGVLMDKATGEPFLVNGNEVTAELTFTAEKSNGSIELEFTFDSTALEGKSVVVFESLYYGEKEVAVHTDIEDERQTIKFAESQVGTTATDKETGDHTGYVSKTTTIVDVVAYENLIVGLEYTVKGVLMEKTTGEPLLVEGNEVTAELTFTAEKSTGSVELEFTFDSTALEGKSVVVFESLYYEEKEVAVHTDIEDEGQTVKFAEPQIGTTAADKETGDHTGYISKTTTIVDVVAYENLIVGLEYAVKGVLMDKATGEPLLVDGNEVAAELTFTAKKSNGSVDLEFTFDSTALEGKSVVVFESLYYNRREIADHADIKDEGQTVKFMKEETKETSTEAPTSIDSAKSPKTDDNSILPIFSVILAISGGIVGILGYRRKKVK